MLADEAVGLDGPGAGVAFDVATLWGSRPDLRGPGEVGLDGRLRRRSVAPPSASRCSACSARCSGRPSSARRSSGWSAVFGGKQVLSERRRQLADRRQQARSFVAGFVEEVRFEADGRLASLLDEVQRQMRARFAERIRELRRTFAESEAGLERDDRAGRVGAPRQDPGPGAPIWPAIDDLRDRAVAAAGDAS